MRIASIAAGLLFASFCASAATNIAGDWALTFDTPNGKVESTLELKQSGEKITGTLHNQFGDSAITGLVRGNEVSFQQTIELNGKSFTVNWTGKIAWFGKVESPPQLPERMKGKFDLGDADWSAERK